MKKTLFESEDLGNGYLYVGIEPVWGEFILETGGDPVTLNTLQEDDCEDLIESINNVIANPNTYWEPCDEEDEKYVSEWLEIWGIDHD